MRHACLLAVLLGSAAAAAQTAPAPSATPSSSTGVRPMAPLLGRAAAPVATVAVTAAAPVGAASNGQTRTLADVARERKLGKKPATSGTFSVAGVSGGSDAQLAAQNTRWAAAANAEDAAWRARGDAARGELSAAQRSLADADATMPNVVSFGRRPGAGHAIAVEQRESALLPYRMRVKDAQSKMETLKQEASTAGVPGLVR